MTARGDNTAVDVHTGIFESISESECWELLRTHQVGRIAAQTEAGVLVLPVNYVVDDSRIVFRTSPTGALSSLAAGHTVAFQIDDIDSETLTGWSVLAQGASGTPESPSEPAPQPWVHDQRDLWIAISVTRVSGRLVEK